jgi:NAD(P)-dependent dehydrogenase (short-subunit alcohol dehydrogenase family)
MAQQTIMVFGGSAGIGEATAVAAGAAGLRVIIVGRDPERLEQAVRRIGAAESVVADATDRESVERALRRAGTLDHVVICASGGKGAGMFRDLDLDALREAFEAKTLAQFTVAQVAAHHLPSSGSITFVTAASARSVIGGSAGLAAVNGAIEAAVPVLALELAPLRVNAVSPGIIDTPWWSGMPVAAKQGFFANAERALPVRRVGRPEEVARAILFIAQNGFVTGSVYEVDGGSHLVTQ